ncbi:excalibur calcium-binding domain-containing protein [Paenibacillus sp. LHD-38]|uniref:excalibur calcium-binding domain-containing protein n=1 Tax=Paenibacillus sp. LHD-38 TaxID=3072143 RepID=UPI0035BE2998
MPIAKARGFSALNYKNCTELNKDYSGGVAQSASVKNKGGKTKYKLFVSKALYDANKKSDRDKDLIACER